MKGKKLLILGANAETISLVRTAQRMGVYVIVTDNVPNAPAKKIADKFYDIDGKDIKGLVDIVCRENVDGILVGCADALVQSYVSLCQAVSLPCYINNEALGFFTDKSIFKKCCSMIGIPVLKEYYKGSNFTEVVLNEKDYPVVVKPAVGRGGKGVKLCANIAELEEAFFLAQKYSDTENVLIESFCDGEDVVLCYIISDGEPFFISLTDRKVMKMENKICTVTFGNYYPSKYEKLFMEKYHDYFCRLIKSLHIENGILNLQMFVKEDVMYPYDPNGILDGEVSSVVYPRVLNVDVLQYFVEFALSGKVSIKPDAMLKKSCSKRKAASIWLILKPGKISKIIGREILQEYDWVLDYVWRLEEGMPVGQEFALTEKATLARVWIVADDVSQLKQRERVIRDGIIVLDEKGQNMIYKLEELGFV